MFRICGYEAFLHLAGAAIASLAKIFLFKRNMRADFAFSQLSLMSTECLGINPAAEWNVRFSHSEKTASKIDRLFIWIFQTLKIRTREQWRHHVCTIAPMKKSICLFEVTPGERINKLKQTLTSLRDFLKLMLRRYNALSYHLPILCENYESNFI